jgi:Condensation domain/TubC N-terminal docking domain
VTSANSQVSMDRVAEFLASVRNKGVKLWCESGQLHYKAPKGVLTQEDIDGLRISRGQIVTLLERSAGAQATELELEPRSRLERAPLAFSQLAHWHQYKLSERRAIRQIASATRIRGRLNVEVLQKSIAEVVRRHDALRTRIVALDGVPVQEIAESSSPELEFDDLTVISDSDRETQVRLLIDKHILEQIDVAADPLFRVWLLRIRDDEHVLIMAIEHMASDGFSLNILIHELFTAYIQGLKGQAFSLPEVPIQFAEYAVRQRNSLQSWLEEHGAYWNERLAGCHRLRFPAYGGSPAASRVGWGVVPVRIGSQLKSELGEWSRLRRTTLVMSVFTAYVGLVLRWCDARECIIQYQSDGRTSPEIQSTVGYLASVLYLRMELLENNSFVDLLNRVTDEYCKAYEHADSSYFAAQVPRPEWTRNSAFNWLPRESKFDSFVLDDAITCSPVRFVPPLARILDTDGEPSIGLLDTEEGEIAGEVWFPLNRFSVATMERFGRNFLVFIRALLRQPEGRVHDVSLV